MNIKSITLQLLAISNCAILRAMKSQNRISPLDRLLKLFVWVVDNLPGIVLQRRPPMQMQLKPLYI